MSCIPWLRNSFTMGYLPVGGDVNPQGLVTSGRPCVQLEKHGISILYNLHQCRPCIDKSGVFHANQISIYLDPHLN